VVVSILSVNEVAEYLRVHRNTVKRIPPDELPYFRVGHRGDRRYRLQDVLAYIRERFVQ
jgi:excisionase family DNA binding protein